MAWELALLVGQGFDPLKNGIANPRQFFYMAIETNLSRVPLRSLGLSHELIQLLDDAGIYTLQDFEDRTSDVFRSKYYTIERLHEITNSLLKQMYAIQELHAKYERRHNRWWRRLGRILRGAKR